VVPVDASPKAWEAARYFLTLDRDGRKNKELLYVLFNIYI
jgi:hypothetical protein